MAEKTQSAEHEPEQRKRQQAPEPPAFAEVRATQGETAIYTRGIGGAAGEPTNLAASLLADRARPLQQRQAIATSIERIHGNQHLGRLNARLDSGRASAMVQRNGPTPAPAAASGGTGPVGAMAAGEAIRARAQEILQNTFGSFTPIIPTPVQVVDEAALRKKFDEVQVRKGTNNTRTGEPWKMGDSLLVFQRLDGFADRDNNMIYVPDGPGGAGEGQLPTVVHEMLHTKAARLAVHRWIRHRRRRDRESRRQGVHLPARPDDANVRIAARARGPTRARGGRRHPAAGLFLGRLHPGERA